MFVLILINPVKILGEALNMKMSEGLELAGLAVPLQ